MEQNKMKLLFVQSGSRVKTDTQGNYYTDGNFNEEVWKRYLNLADEFCLILRKEDKVYSEEYAQKHFNYLNTNKIRYVPVTDVYRPIKNYFNFALKRKIKNTIESEVLRADKIIVRSPDSYYSYLAIKLARKHNKSYLVEVTGFAFSSLWHQGIKGKLVALPSELRTKRIMKNAAWGLYVTNYALQKSYPCPQHSCGCSDVVLKFGLKPEKSFDTNKILKLGTAAFLDVEWKGQKDVIKALAKLKKMGVKTFKYSLVGLGTGKKLKKLVKKYELDDIVCFDGAKSYTEMPQWYDTLDIYVQPSYQEGLCRAIVEAMSRSCPVVCSDVGGNSELIDKKYIYHAGKIDELIEILSNLSEQELVEMSNQNYSKSLEFKEDILDKKRNEFFKKFIEN